VTKAGDTGLHITCVHGEEYALIAVSGMYKKSAGEGNALVAETGWHSVLLASCLGRPIIDPMKQLESHKQAPFMTQQQDLLTKEL
jgi:hypothetical protein